MDLRGHLCRGAGKGNNVFNILLDKVVQPMLRRMGTAFAVYLVTLGVGAEVADQIALGATALAGVGVDLALSAADKKRRR